MQSKPNSAGYRTVTPYLKLPNCGALTEFLKKAFNAIEKDRLLKPDGSLLHAEVIIGDTLLMIHELPGRSVPKPCTLYLRVADSDSTYRQAIEAGAISVFEPANMYYGDRVACVTDIAGNDWWIATPIEHFTLPDIQQRATTFLKSKTGEK